MTVAVEKTTFPVIECFGPTVRCTEKSGIYVIHHRASRRVYVGSATNLSKRWSHHRKDLAAGTHRNAHLQAAWNAYGADAFDWYIVELTSDLDAREQFWMDALDAYENGFNLCPIARSSRGRRWSDAERLSREQNLSNRRPESAEARERRCARAKAMARDQRKLTDEQAEELRSRYGAPQGNARPHQRTSGKPTMQTLATEYGVSLGVVHAIIRRKAYV